MQKEITKKEPTNEEIIKKYLGCAKPRPRLTKGQLEQIALNHTPKRAREISKKYGFTEDEIVK